MDITKVHSTPRHTRTYEVLNTPSVSTISNPPSSPRSVTSSNDYANGVLGSDISFKINKRGKTWTINQPQIVGRLYYNIIHSDYEDIQYTAETHALKILDGDETALEKLYELILEVSDYQNYVSTYSFNESNFHNILKELDNRKPEHNDQVKDGLYHIALCKNDLKQAMFGRVINFLEYLIEHLHVKSSINKHFKQFLLFLHVLSKSRFIVLKHTVTAIAIKLLTKFIKMSINKTRETVLNSYNKVLHTIYNKNCSIQCKQLNLMRIQCLYESVVWIICMPDYWNMCFRHIMNAIKDTETQVCIYGLKSLKQLLTELNCESNLPIIMKLIKTRLKDDHCSVRKLTLEFCSTIIERYNYQFSEEIQGIFKYLIYDEDASVGRQACIIYRDILMKHIINEENLFQIIVAFVARKLNLLPCFAESAKKLFPILDKFDRMFEFLNLYIEPKREIILMLILQCAVQKITGKSSYERSNSQNDKPNAEESLMIIDIVLKNMDIILNQNKPAVLKALQEFLLIVPPQEIIAKDCFQMLQNMFRVSINDDTLDTISTILFSNYKEHNVIFLQENVEMFNSCNELCITLEQFSDEFCTNIKKVQYKFAFIIQKVDVTDYLRWNVLFELVKWFNTNIDYLTDSILICSCWYLIWKCRRLASVTNVDVDEVQILCTNMAEFIDCSINIITTHKSSRLKFCNCLFTLIINFSREETNFFGNVKLSKYIFSDEQQQQMYMCIEQELFASNRNLVPVEYRRNILGMYFYLIGDSRINWRYLIIFRYFKEFQAEYGDYFRAYWDKFIPHRANIFIHVLHEISELKERSHVEDQVKYFATILAESSCYDILKILIKRRQEYDFLKYLTPIANKLSRNHRFEINKLFTKERSMLTLSMESLLDELLNVKK